jgi:hypothetical protein
VRKNELRAAGVGDDRRPRRTPRPRTAVRIGVVGAGAIGATYASFLARAGHEVAVLDGVRPWRRSPAGLVAELPDATAVAGAVGRRPIRRPRPPRWLVATKAFATGGRPGAGPLIGPGTGCDRRTASATTGRSHAVGPAASFPARRSREAAGDGRVRIESVLAGRSSAASRWRSSCQ